jgi:hypothetical protein
MREQRLALTTSFAMVGTLTMSRAKADPMQDNVLTGSSNKAIYESAARKHVRSAMEGFNAVIFAYGQTASGKTFTLVCSHSRGCDPQAEVTCRVATTKNLVSSLAQCETYLATSKPPRTESISCARLISRYTMNKFMTYWLLALVHHAFRWHYRVPVLMS